MTTKPNVFEYIDYRKYLTEWRVYAKKKNPGLTHEYLCKVLGWKNRSFYNDVEKGRRMLSVDTIDRLSELFDFTTAEAKYFRALVGYAQPATYTEKEFWFEQIVELNNTPKRLIDKNAYRYFKEWYHSSVRAVLDIADIGSDYHKLVKLLFNRITVKEARESIQLLSDLNMIRKNEKGYWKPTDKILSTGDSVKNECIRHYQLAHNAMLRKILEEDKPGTHNSSQLTISVSREGLERIERRIKQIRTELISISHKDEKHADRVYQVAVHLYPLSGRE